MKSNVSDYLKFMHQVYIDACMKCIADVSDLRDLETIRSRVEHEGLSFLTITLPLFARDFERSLANGKIDSTMFPNFGKIGPIPSFLRGMTSQVFDCETGRICNEDSPQTSVIIEGVRQICLSFKKIEFACSPEREQAAVDNYIAIERSFELFSVPEEVHSEFTRVASVLWGPLVSTIVLSDCSPTHGPGATAERVSGNRKYVWRIWHDRLEPYFPLIDNGYPLGLPLDSEELEMVSIKPRELEQPVRVVLVPKTLKSPRVIAIEPACMQYVQQGIRSVLYRKIESYWLTKGHVNFTDQSVNQKLAINSSITGQLATIDLSDASDRVPRSLALEMFRSNPDLMDAIDACRSTSAELPDGSIIGPLGKFASMGSALCFPVEAMYFYTVCVVAILKSMNLPVTPKGCYIASRGVHVYGDDIVVPRTYAITVLDHLRKYNCKVNANKTFVSGSFQESCGEDAFRGERVTPVYLRKSVPENGQQADRLISWTKTANLFYLKGYWRTASFMFNKLERIIGPLPYLSEESAGLGRVSLLGYRSIERWNEKYQRFEVKALVPTPVYRADKLMGYGALMKCFLRLSVGSYDPLVSVFDAHHLEQSALHGAVTLKRRWVPSH